MWEENIFSVFFKNPCFKTLTTSFLVAPSCLIFFSSDGGRKKEREEDEKMVIRLSLLGSLDDAAYYSS